MEMINAKQAAEIAYEANGGVNSRVNAALTTISIWINERAKKGFFNLEGTLSTKLNSVEMIFIENYLDHYGYAIDKPLHENKDNKIEFKISWGNH